MHADERRWNPKTRIRYNVLTQHPDFKVYLPLFPCVLCASSELSERVVTCSSRFTNLISFMCFGILTMICQISNHDIDALFNIF